MTFAEDDDIIDASPSDSADDPFRFTNFRQDLHERIDVFTNIIVDESRKS